MQDNSLRTTVLTDIKSVLEDLNLFREVSDETLGPDEVQLFPSAYYTGGDGDREPADIQYYHFKHEAEFVIVLYVHSTESEGMVNTITGLSKKLEYVIEKVLDAFDLFALNDTVGTLAHGYKWHVSRIETDAAALRMTGLRVAMAVLTLTVALPPRTKT